MLCMYMYIHPPTYIYEHIFYMFKTELGVSCCVLRACVHAMCMCLSMRPRMGEYIGYHFRSETNSQDGLFMVHDMYLFLFVWACLRLKDRVYVFVHHLFFLYLFCST